MAPKHFRVYSIYSEGDFVPMKEGSAMNDAENPQTPIHGDIPESWGFHLLQELRRMEDKSDAKFDSLETKMDARIDNLESKMDAKFVAMDLQIHSLEDKMDAKIDALESKMDAKIDALESKMDAKIDGVELRTNARIDNVTQEVRALRYWSWGAILTVIAGAIATILTVLSH